MATEELNNTNSIQKEFQSLLDQDFKDRKLKENEIIKATVTEITKNFIVVDCKAKMEGMIPIEEFKNDDELNSFICDNVESAYHPCGTCKMGDRADPMSVVDPETRVIGIEKLRVADSSIFPQITNGNLNAPSIMVGEKASDHILGKNLLPRSNDIPWVNPNWDSSQR